MQDRLLVKVPAEQLQPDREGLLPVNPQGIDIPGMPARFTLIVKMSDRYIWSGSDDFSPILNAAVGAVGVAMTSHGLECLLKVLFDQRARLLAFFIVRIIISCRKRIGAEHDAAA